MDDGDERDAWQDDSPDHDTPYEGISLEGLRPPLTLEQRRRRAAIAAIVVASALAVLLWPAVSSHINSLARSSAPVATATRGGFTSGSQFQSGVTIVVGTSSGASGT
ncbi:MAG TPA: hypothetical protein VH591_09560, partial [Ktedonobacterales bacterium]